MNQLPNLQLARREWTFIFLAGLMITNAITAELISSKLIDIPVLFRMNDWQLGPFTTIVGVLPWPVVFILTDLLNEFYGEKAVKKLSWITAILIGYCFLMVYASLQIPSSTLVSGPGLATDREYYLIFGQAPWIILGSITAFVASQLLDSTIFHWIKNKTGNRYVALRSTGSTVVSQLIDSVIVLYIGFVIPGKLSMAEFFDIVPVNYSLKLIIAIALTPVIYLGHWMMRKWLSNGQ
ncbi:MAG: hypothetical protein RLY35_1196 [Bacteroidota bacterium]|jgi:uncharacterized integral membrane protein (TIGR00697 family)